MEIRNDPSETAATPDRRRRRGTPEHRLEGRGECGSRQIL